MLNENEIIEIIHAIGEKKKELADAQFIVEFYPTIIDELELRLINLVREDGSYGVNGRFKGKEKNKPSKRILYR